MGVEMPRGGGTAVIRSNWTLVAVLVAAPTETAGVGGDGSAKLQPTSTKATTMNPILSRD